MNILITGGNGFVGRNLRKYLLPPNYIVYAVSHNELDVLCLSKLQQFINKNNIDVIIHAAISGGRRIKQDDISVFNTNVKMWDNIVDAGKNCKLIINFGSGAEFDRRFPIDKARPEHIFKVLPLDYYGLSKNLISRSINTTINNAVNLRIFNCFGLDEGTDRFITSCILKDTVEIFEDKLFDFFYIEDLCKVIKFYIDKPNIPFKDINCVYTDKYRLSEIANKLGVSKITIIKSTENHYTGSANQLQNLDISLFGLDFGLQQMRSLKHEI